MEKVSYSGGVRRNRPKMVRQNHIDIDSDSSESKSHLLPWNTNTLPLPSKKHKERLARDVSLTNSYPLESTLELLQRIKIDAHYLRLPLIN